MRLLNTPPLIPLEIPSIQSLSVRMDIKKRGKGEKGPPLKRRRTTSDYSFKLPSSSTSTERQTRRASFQSGAVNTRSGGNPKSVLRAAASTKTTKNKAKPKAKPKATKTTKATSKSTKPKSNGESGLKSTTKSSTTASKTKSSKVSSAKSSNKPKAKPKARKKNVGVPKRPLSAYNFFFRERRPKILEDEGDLTFSELGKIIGTKWSSMNQSAKKQFEQMATNDRKRYSEEVRVFDEHARKNGLPTVADLQKAARKPTTKKPAVTYTLDDLSDEMSSDFSLSD
eukprot:TRINITY_DN776099_c0_g1_i1.p1 TRINITY_DN776099_c0_g1~~TRINITY_DN776099_c0_g1_i1.p1  ORF type:complete len:283 (-),score=74.74 TRINITY_DN776099_c0_g1_i1:235-1083(-)